MKLGYFDTFNRPDMVDDFTTVLEDARAQAIACDQLGFHSYWLGEHHFNHVGIDPMPNPILFGADIAARTRNIRIGQACVTLPMWHPVRLAEDIALLDQMTLGRVEIGIGKGNRPREGMIFHPDADPRRKDAQNALHNEVLEVMIKAWTQEFFSHHGKYFQIPPRGIPWTHPMIETDERWYRDGEVTAICLMPKTYQKPHPPLWSVSDSDGSLTYAAGLKQQVIVWQPPVETLKHKFQLYQRARTAAEGRPMALGEGIGVMRPVYVAETMEQARADTERAILFIYDWVHPPARGLHVFARPGEQMTGSGFSWEFLMERDNLLIGDIDFVAEKIAELRDDVGVDNLFVQANLPWLPQSKIMKSLERLMTEVMPRVNAVRAPLARAAAG